MDTINFVKNKNAKKNIISELKLPNDTILVGLFGRYAPQKNHIGFIEAAKIVRENFPHVHFILSGRGIDYNNISLINILEKYKLKKLHCKIYKIIYHIYYNHKPCMSHSHFQFSMICLSR